MNLSTREEDKDRIVASLETIAQALLGSVLETMRSSVHELGVETERLISGLREETKGSLEALRADMQSADESVARETITAVETRANSMTEHSESRIEATRSDLNQRLEEVECRLQKEHLSILERLDGAERGLIGHEATSARITEFLDTMGNVFARGNAPRDAAPILSHPTPVSVANPSPDHDGVAPQVEVKLEGLAQLSEIETQPEQQDGSHEMVTEEVEGALDRVDLTASPTTPRAPE